jgi:hypothetical protein
MISLYAMSITLPSTVQLTQNIRAYYAIYLVVLSVCTVATAIKGCKILCNSEPSFLIASVNLHSIMCYSLKFFSSIAHVVMLTAKATTSRLCYPEVAEKT